jgi:ribose 5-phosphate isomerase B
MKIGIASDHRGYRLKKKLIDYLTKKKYEVIDLGTNSTTSVDYPDYAIKLANSVLSNEVDQGIAICGSGIGISIACNKIDGIRCAKVDSPKEARLAKLDNDANVIALNGSMMSYKAKDILDAFLKTKFSNLERHISRLEKIKEIENSQKNKVEDLDE